MVLGGTVTVICLLALAWVREIVGNLLEVFGVDAQSEKLKAAVIFSAMVLMYCLDFAINTSESLRVPFPSNMKSDFNSSSSDPCFDC